MSIKYIYKNEKNIGTQIGTQIGFKNDLIHRQRKRQRQNITPIIPFEGKLGEKNIFLLTFWMLCVIISLSNFKSVLWTSTKRHYIMLLSFAAPADNFFRITQTMQHNKHLLPIPSST